MRPINEVIIHCSATQPAWAADKTIQWKRDEIDTWHKDRGFGATFEGQTYHIGYHWLIDRNGNLLAGRPEGLAGAHVAGHNSNSIGVCLIGGHGSSAKDNFEDHFTPEQATTLRMLLSSLNARYPSIKKVSGHNEYANKACPGFEVTPWLKREPAPEPRTSIAQSKTIQASQVTKIASAVTPLVGILGGLEWPQMLILIATTAVILVATGIIDMERVKKWRAGDR